MVLMILLVLSLSAAGEKQAPVLLSGDIRIRDPFVLPVSKEQIYYRYGTGSPLGKWGFDAYASKNLEHSACHYCHLDRRERSERRKISHVRSK